MKKNLLILTLGLFILSCTTEKKNMIVTCNINGLQTGKLYLQKVSDTLIVNVDSVKIEGSNTVVLSTNIESPEIYFISLAETDKVFQFFGEKGAINIKTDMDTFNYEQKITGSKNDSLLKIYNTNISKYNSIRLDLIKLKFDAGKNIKKLDSVNLKLTQLEKRIFRYTLNFAFNNTNYNVSPYLTLSKLYNLNTTYLDTIANALSPEVKKSKYGKKLISYIQEIKSKENIQKEN